MSYLFKFISALVQIVSDLSELYIKITMEVSVGKSIMFKGVNF